MAAKKKTAKKKVTRGAGKPAKKAIRKPATRGKKSVARASAPKVVKKTATAAKKKPAGKSKTAKRPAAAAKKPAPKKTAAKKPAPKAVTSTRTKPAATVKSAAPVKKAPAVIKPAKQTIKTSPQKKTTQSVVTSAPVKTKMSTESQSIIGAPRNKRAPYQKKTGEEYMSPAQVEHFRLLLLDWKHDLLEEVDRTVHHMQDEAANFPDPNDRATQEEEFALELRTRDRERKLIKKINDALTALDNNEYGYCEQCGVEIGVQRLEARPTATLCIDCKTLDEIKEKQLGQ